MEKMKIQFAGYPREKKDFEKLSNENLTDSKGYISREKLVTTFIQAGINLANQRFGSSDIKPEDSEDLAENALETTAAGNYFEETSSDVDNLLDTKEKVTARVERAVKELSTESTEQKSANKKRATGSVESVGNSKETAENSAVTETSVEQQVKD